MYEYYKAVVYQGTWYVVVDNRYIRIFKMFCVRAIFLLIAGLYLIPMDRPVGTAFNPAAPVAHTMNDTWQSDGPFSFFAVLLHVVFLYLWRWKDVVVNLEDEDWRRCHMVSCRVVLCRVVLCRVVVSCPRRTSFADPGSQRITAPWVLYLYIQTSKMRLIVCCCCCCCSTSKLPTRFFVFVYWFAHILCIDLKINVLRSMSLLW